jgi:hypothetical protein
MSKLLFTIEPAGGTIGAPVAVLKYETSVFERPQLYPALPPI